MEKFKKIVIVGAGTMGHGIAQVFAQNGYPVSLVDTETQALARADALIKSSLSTMVEAKIIQRDEIESVMARITPTTQLEKAAKDADLVIECIIEDKGAKKDIFQKLDNLCPPETILSSNSTFLNIFDFVETNRPAQVLMTHWYAPPQIIPLVDVVKGPETDGSNILRVTELLKEMGKKPVVFNKPCAGYIISRLQIAFQREVYWLLDNDYVSAQDLDEAAIWGLAMRMMIIGICQRIDFGGLDLSAKTTLEAAEKCTPLDYKPVKLLELVRQGSLGVKSGKGFYDYDGKTEAEMCRNRDIRLLKLYKILKENDLPGPLI